MSFVVLKSEQGMRSVSHVQILSHLILGELFIILDQYLVIVPYRCNRTGLQVLCPSVCQSVRLYVRLSTKFSGLFSTMCAAIVLKLCTWLYIYDLQIKFEDGCYRPIFRRVLLLERIISFPDFFVSVYRYSFDIWYIALPYQDTYQV